MIPYHIRYLNLLEPAQSMIYDQNKIISINSDILYSSVTPSQVSLTSLTYQNDKLSIFDIPNEFFYRGFAIKSITGETIIEQDISYQGTNLTLHIPDLASGVYFVQLFSPTGVIFGKFMVVR